MKTVVSGFLGVEVQQSPKQLQTQKQQITLSAQMRFSLEVLRLPLPDLKTVLEEQLLENPLLDTEDIPEPGTEEGFAEVYLTEYTLPSPSVGEENGLDLYDPPSHQSEVTLPQHLLEQLLGMELDKQTRALCEFIIYCLNDRGYLDFSPEELAEETGVSIFVFFQALYIIQSLDPLGVAAQSLEECLLLQLAAGNNFCKHTVKAVRGGLPWIARGNMKELAKWLGCTIDEAKHAAQIVKTLHPVPARGFGGGAANQIMPDAAVCYEDNSFHIQINRRALPCLTLDKFYSSLLRQPPDKETQRYLQQKNTEATYTLKALEDRYSTLSRVLESVVSHQPAFFREGGPLRPMTLADVAGGLGIHISTVSRAVNEKYIVCATGTVHLKDLFQTALAGKGEESVSQQFALTLLKKCVENEDATNPLSDEKLRDLLCDNGVNISRRTVAKYRGLLGIASAGTRAG